MECANANIEHDDDHIACKWCGWCDCLNKCHVDKEDCEIYDLYDKGFGTGYIRQDKSLTSDVLK